MAALEGMGGTPYFEEHTQYNKKDGRSDWLGIGGALGSDRDLSHHRNAGGLPGTRLYVPRMADGHEENSVKKGTGERADGGRRLFAQRSLNKTAVTLPRSVTSAIVFAPFAYHSAKQPLDSAHSTNAG